MLPCSQPHLYSTHLISVILYLRNEASCHSWLQKVMTTGGSDNILGIISSTCWILGAVFIRWISEVHMVIANPASHISITTIFQSDCFPVLSDYSVQTLYCEVLLFFPNRRDS